MLEADDMEEDYFTPASSTTLANIFKKRNNNYDTENESLKYTPPKPQSISPKPEEPKATQCIMACALYGYEWVDNVFTSKGMLGFAIMKIIKSGLHNIILYDSNKKTLSCSSITSALKVTVKGNVNFSYYDNAQKYWSIYCKQEEGKKIIEILQNLNAIIKYSTDNENEPSQERERESPITTLMTELSSQADKQESDTDSSINRRTKMSILNRMATMGHSVLPPHSHLTEKASDSSDTNDTDNYTKATRHKVKGAIKRNNSEKNVFDIQSLSEMHKISKTDQPIENTPAIYTHVGGQLVPVTNTNILTTPSCSTNEMNIFMSEQRVSNSEVRINISRMTDKVDTVLSKLTDITNKGIGIASDDFQTEILKKLLGEYENKIKSYEEIIRTKTIDKPSNLTHVSDVTKPPSQHNNATHEDIITLNSKIIELQENNKEKQNKIIFLESEVNKLQEKCSEFTVIKTNHDTLLDVHEKLIQEIASKNEELIAIKNKNNISTGDTSNYEDSTKDKVKNIMNDTFHAIAANFENDNKYTGDTIKTIVAAVIKRVTIESL